MKKTTGIKFFIFIFSLFLFFIFLNKHSSSAYSYNSVPGVNITTEVPSLPNLPINIRGLVPGSVTEATSELKLFNSKSFSSGDVIGIGKGVAVLGINLFLIVIQSVAGILKALLPFVS